MAIQGSHMVVNGQFGVCYGSVEMGDGNEASCVGGFLPVEGMTLAEAGEAPALTVGRWDGSVFHGVRSYQYGAKDSPVSQFAETPPAKPDLCEEKTGAGSSVGFDELWARAEQLPGFQDLWIPDDEPMDHAQVAVTEGIEEAEDALLSEFGFSLCVGTVPGPDAATLDEAEATIAELWPRAPGELKPFILTTSQVEEDGNTLTVLVLDDSDEFTSRVRDAVGPDVWPYTTVKAALVPVDAEALEPSEDN